jgi:hypothetical protein
MPHAVRVALLVCLCLPLAATAAPLTYSFSGSIDSVTDSDDFLDSSVAPTVSVSGTYEVDPATTSSSSPFTVGPSHLVFGLGNYGFDQSEDPDTIRLINDTGPPGFEVDLWQSGSLTVSDLAGGTNSSGNFAGYAARIEFFDNTHSNFDGTESAPTIPDDIVGWTQARLILDSLKDNGDGTSSPDGRVQVQVNFSSWSIVPEPNSSALVALGLVWLALRARQVSRSEPQASEGQQTRVR